MVKKNIGKKILILGIVISIFILLYFSKITIPCIFNTITGLYCPGCGITRAITSLMHGDIYQALRYNLLLFLVVPSIILILLIEKIFGKYKWVRVTMNVLTIMLCVVTIMYGVLRNIPRFSFLAPIKVI